MLGASAPCESGASSMVTPNTWPTSDALAENASSVSMSWPAPGPSGWSFWITTDLPSGSMKVRSRGSVPEGGEVGSTTPEKPVTIGSPGAKIASAACDALAAAKTHSAANSAATKLVVTRRTERDTVALPLPVSAQAHAPQHKLPQEPRYHGRVTISRRF